MIEGRFGFLQAFCGDRVHVERVTDGLGEVWETTGVFFKPYPCNHFTHAGIDAALALRARGVDPARIRALTLGVPAPVLRTIAEPPEEKARPRSGYLAAFSGPYTVAAALVGGGGLGVFHEDFTDAAAADPQRLNLAARVRVVADAESTEIFPRQFPAVLTAELVDGTVLTERVRANRGGPANPLAADELSTKFRGNAGRALSPSRAADVVSQVWNLRDGEPVRDLMSTLTGLPGR